MNASYVDEVKKSPKKNIVRVKLATILQEISAFKTNNVPFIFLVEGKDDVIVYERWLDKVDYKLTKKIIDVGNKDLVLEIYSKIKERHERLGNLENILACVDNDFDGFKNFEKLRNDEHLYLTDMYSIENYIASEQTLNRILSCEFRCRNDEDENKVIAVFKKDFDSFLHAVKDLNFKIYLCRKNDIKIAIKTNEDLNKNFSIHIMNVEVKNQNDILCYDETILFNIEEHVKSSIKNTFDMLDGKNNYRGKFNYLFFTKWVQALAINNGIPGSHEPPPIKICNLTEDEIKNRIPLSPMIDNVEISTVEYHESIENIENIRKSKRVKLNAEQWNISFYASHSTPPKGFEDFIHRVTNKSLNDRIN